MAEKEQALEVEGVVTQALANTRFRVQIQGGHIVNAHVAGKMRKNFIRIVPGDVVDVMYGDTPLSDADRAAIKASLGMDKPLGEQYVNWVIGVIKLDAGNSLWTRKPVFQEIADRLRRFL